MEVLVEYHHEREGNLEHKFKLGYLKVLEEKISTKLPSSGLRVKLDIESRLKTLRGFYHCSSKIVICRSNFRSAGHLIEDSQDFFKDKLIIDLATS